MSGDGIQPYLGHLFRSRSQSHYAGNIGCAGFKFLWYRRIGAFLKADGVNHVTTALPWRHRLEQVVFGIQNTDSGWAIELVSRKGIKITIQRLYINKIGR